ncbi:hypothetical protein RhiXN_11916 [Rhizoctonia solani]|uniref:Uncharacterized protein n=1 Tax=Rhizoctonia solani TaxID=456999 RepID=A0A8H8P6V2_9AGAM|nr:uncharacterized protein RhiXN_11916 [Rhizoctonia solani]QRW26255.1 hypothetical protein RhiXN_11916 [Rhizoctonia solani]
MYELVGERLDVQQTRGITMQVGQILENMLKVCNANASVNHLSVDVSCNSLGSNSSSACCCSTATYALVSACWVCQTTKPPNQLSSTYQSWWSGCPVDTRQNGSLPAVVTSRSPPLSVPDWVLVQPSAGDEKWNVSSAQLAVGTIPTSSSTAFPSTSTSAYISTVSTTSSTGHSERSKEHPPYVPIVICSVLALLLLVGMATWLYRRRNKVSPSSRAPPGYDIDGGAMSTENEEHLGRWGWWSRKMGRDSSRKSQSNPDKIDAWLYPLDYEPLSTGPSSGSGGSGYGQYYDPYVQRSRRNSDVHLAHCSSIDTVNIRNQPSAGNLGQHYHSHSRNLTPTPGHSASTRTLATPSPVPGHRTRTPNHVHSNLPPQEYVLPPGLGVDHVRTLAYGSPQPPTYGQTVPYTYPYVQPQPMPSATTTSPRSPQHVWPPTHTHRTHQSQQSPMAHPRRSDQMLMIPVSQMTPDQIEQLRLQFSDVRVRKKKRRRRREGQDAQTDQEDRGRPRAGTDAGQFRAHEVGAGGGRPRSTSVPIQAETEDERPGPRNIVELTAKYEPRRRAQRDVMTTDVGSGSGNANGAVKVDNRASQATFRTVVVLVVIGKVKKTNRVARTEQAQTASGETEATTQLSSLLTPYNCKQLEFALESQTVELPVGGLFCSREGLYCGDRFELEHPNMERWMVDFSGHRANTDISNLV